MLHGGLSSLPNLPQALIFWHNIIMTNSDEAASKAQSAADCSDCSSHNVFSFRILGYRSIPDSSVAPRDARDGRYLNRHLRSRTRNGLALTTTVNPSRIAGCELWIRPMSEAHANGNGGLVPMIKTFAMDFMVSWLVWKSELSHSV